ncbi:MAG: aminoglycoside phosphotransferase family protein [Candidatus Liptonbacteria bacterium]|nr:aminoglycoside phosphotransferase family protein [Candidatus Liptonbacteria bacterium]
MKDMRVGTHEGPEEQKRYTPGDYRIEIPIEVAENSIRISFPDFPLRTIELLDADRSGGFQNAVFIVNGNYIFRFPRHEKANQSVIVESVVLPKLQRTLDLPIPQIEFVGQQLNGLQFIGYKLIEGIELDKRFLLAPENAETRFKPKLVGKIATFLRQIHAFDIEEAKRGGVEIRDPRTFYQGKLQDARDNLYPFFEKSFSEEAPAFKTYIEKLFEEYFNNPKNFDFQPTLLHGDLESEHIMYSEERDDIAGIIDFGGIKIHDPDYDLWRPYYHYGREFIEELLKTYPHSDPDFLFKKMDFYWRAQVIHRIVRRLVRIDDVSHEVEEFRKLYTKDKK